MQLGYFQVIAEPVSTCVQVIFEFAPAAIAALGDEVVDAARPFSSPGYQFCTVEYLIFAFVQRDQLDDRGVQLVLVAHRRGAAFEVAHVAPSSAMISVRSNWPVLAALMRK